MCEWQPSGEFRDHAYECSVPPEEGSKFCVFHEPGEKDIERFKHAFYLQIRKEGSPDERNAQYDFRGYVFPMGLTVRGEETELILPREIDGDLIMAEATIEGYASFANATINRGTDFRNAKIEGHASFGGATFKEDADFEGVTIKGRASFTYATFEAGTDFRYATFKEYASFRDATFEGGTDFRYATFKENAYFDRVTIVGNADFEDATFGAGTDFRDAKIEGQASLRNAKIEGKADFMGATIKWSTNFVGTEASAIYLGERRPTILWWETNREGVTLKEWSSGYTFWTFARRTFEKMNERERADAAYYFEKLWQRRSRLSRVAATRTRILATLGYPFDLLLLRIPIAYGTSLIRPLMSWFVVIMLFGGLYAGCPSLIGRTVKSIWTLSNWVISMHFSVTTFTTLGLGDIHPGRLLGKALTSIEAVVGGVLMALTVVVISRKLMR